MILNFVGIRRLAARLAARGREGARGGRQPGAPVLINIPLLLLLLLLLLMIHIILTILIIVILLMIIIVIIEM